MERLFQGGWLSLFLYGCMMGSPPRPLSSGVPLQASGQDIGDVMNNWTRQPGYPVVSVEEASPGTFRLQQKRFFASREEDSGDQFLSSVLFSIFLCPFTLSLRPPHLALFLSPPSRPCRRLWKIPLGYTTSEGGTHFHLMQEAQEEVQLPSAHDWVYFNAHQVQALVQPPLSCGTHKLAARARSHSHSDKLTWASDP